MANSREAESKNLIRRYVETWNKGDIEGLSRFWAHDMIHHTRTKKQGFDEIKQIVKDFAKAFPDLQFHLADIIAEGDRVATRMIYSGRAFLASSIVKKFTYGEMREVIDDHGKNG